MKIAQSELIINPNGSIYHLNLLPEDVATTIITVGDQNRVPMISKHFDRIEVKKNKREFYTVTGWIGNKRITVISTGIGTDNVDIVVNEIDALFNIDFNTREIKEQLTKLHFIRIGTCGGLLERIPVDSFIVSEHAIGLDGLMDYYPYENQDMELSRIKISSLLNNQKIYLASCNSSLLAKSSQFIKGTTLSANGFYGPQGRKLRIPPKYPKMITDLSKLRIGNTSVTNLEMETAGLYALAGMLGHESISYSVILANRQAGTFSEKPKESVEKLIETALDTIAA